MKNIVDTVIELVNEKGAVTTAEIAAAISNDVLAAKPKTELEAMIYTDLLTDGRFLKVERKWDLKENYTMREVMREQYRTLGEFDDYQLEDEEDEIVEEEEIELKTVIEENDDEEITVSVDDIK